jgi:hypothetical protein
MNEYNESKDLIKSVSDFLSVKDRWLYTSDIMPGKWLYRGLKNYGYQLIPSIGRLFGKKPFLIKDRLSHFERSAFAEFMINSNHELHENNEFIVLAVAQHHGLKTRLLDWSFSPLVGLFFAVEDETSYDLDGALVAQQTNYLFNNVKNAKTPFDEELDEYHFLSVPYLSSRIRAQQGVFQLFKDPTKELIEAPYLGKFRIPAKYKYRIKNELNELGITYKTVFPDMDGLCKSINFDKLRESRESRRINKSSRSG